MISIMWNEWSDGYEGIRRGVERGSGQHQIQVWLMPDNSYSWMVERYGGYYARGYDCETLESAFERGREAMRLKMAEVE